VVYEGSLRPGEFCTGGHGKFVQYLTAWQDWWRDWEDRSGRHWAELSEENKFVLGFYFRAVNELSINSGLLRRFVEELDMGLDERMRFVRKLNMIHVTIHNIEYEKQEEKRNRSRR
jgi:hypothetical protein